ncbi:uncharacterized protein with HXXEE motif [Ureibacillus xyleni]|uniref:Uncharacterized protein with HXXEE motif n=1 Tax=Ureibacillus xyleni TaxID=614648 RepID=A0A285R6Y9_9BACL|nr:HXXEE domain-containing protein [Ureibacillus xyleni]SOB89863.1 uncharacterized protein with HXXEE motif [Ureibacillus xyleni]
MEIETLIWLFVIAFIFHDFEEIIMVERWMQNNSSKIYKVLPKHQADQVMKQFSMTTAQFAVAVLVMFLFVSSSTFIAIQFNNLYMFIIITLVFFLHSFTHIGQAIIFRSITPGVITSIVILIPYSIILYHSLLSNNIIDWKTIFLCLPFTILIAPVVLFAHWVGKKAI